MFYKEKCIGCGQCHDITANDSDFVCFSDAKEICGKTITSDKVIETVLKDRIFYDHSGCRAASRCFSMSFHLSF